MTDKMELTKHHVATWPRTGGHLHVEADPSKCAGRVYDGWHWNQCRHKRHPDTLDGAFCKQHCPEHWLEREQSREADRAARKAAAQAERDKAARQAELKDEAVRLLTSLAKRPDPDPWAVSDAKQWLAKWEAAQ